MSDLLHEFQRLADAGAGKPGDATALLLRALPSELAFWLRRCAIPHQFDAEILTVLDSKMALDQACSICDELARLAVIGGIGDQWAVHDRARSEIVSWWMQPANRAEFASLSRRLADHYGLEAERQHGAERETSRRQHMYHLLGAEPNRGYEEFERLLRKARHELRFAECAALIRLAGSYAALVTPEQRMWLRYHEGKLALDQRDWARARTLLLEVARNESRGPLAIASRIRLGQLAGQLRDWPSAVPLLEEALASDVADADCAHLKALALCELGIAYRELGRFEAAQKVLCESIDHATRHRLGSLATAFDSVGLLHLKQQRPREAIKSFEESLDYLHRASDVFRSADVHDHMGIAYEQLGDWSSSERHHQESLRIMEAAGDNLGKASVLNNVAGVRARQGKLLEAIGAMEKAIEIFDALNDPYSAAQARQNLGKYLLRDGRREAGRQRFVEAASRFDALAKSAEADRVRLDLANLDYDKGLPWWVWTSIVMLAVMIAVGVAVLMSE